MYFFSLSIGPGDFSVNATVDSRLPTTAVINLYPEEGIYNSYTISLTNAEGDTASPGTVVGEGAAYAWQYVTGLPQNTTITATVTVSSGEEESEPKTISFTTGKRPVQFRKRAARKKEEKKTMQKKNK